MKVTFAKKKKAQPTISSMIDPSINFVGHAPKTSYEEYALGFALNTVHVGANAAVSNESILKYQRSGWEKVREFHTLFVKGNIDKAAAAAQIPPRVTHNDHNIHSGVSAILNGYRQHNNDPDNPFRLLEKSDHYSIVHDATTYFVKQLNTSILRVVKGDGSIVKVPFNMTHVSGSLTGEVLCEELIKEVAIVKKVPGNADDNIELSGECSETISDAINSK